MHTKAYREYLGRKQRGETYPSYLFMWFNPSGQVVMESATLRPGNKKEWEGKGEIITPRKVCINRLNDNKKFDNFEKLVDDTYIFDISQFIEDNPDLFYRQETNTKAKFSYEYRCARYIEDNLVRPTLVDAGFHLDPGKSSNLEYHFLPKGKTIDDMLEIMVNYLYGGIDRTVNFKPKNRTTRRLLNTLRRKKGGTFKHKIIYYGVETGAGKTSDSLMSFVETTRLTGRNKHLFTTPKPDTLSDLAKDIRKAQNKAWRRFKLVVPESKIGDIEYLIPDQVMTHEEYMNTQRSSEYIYILWFSVQDMRQAEGKKYRKLIEKTHFGCWVKDEAHTNYADWGIFAQYVEQYIKHWVQIQLTGTPENILLNAPICDEQQKILFLEKDRIEAAEAGDPDWQGYPTIHTCILDSKKTNTQIANALDLSDEEFVTLGKEWRWDDINKCLYYDDAIDMLIDKRYGLGVYAGETCSFFGPGSPAAKFDTKHGMVLISSGSTSEKTIYVADKIKRRHKLHNKQIATFAAHEPKGYEKWLQHCENTPEIDSAFVSYEKGTTGKNNPYLNYGWVSRSIASLILMGQFRGRFKRKLFGKDDVVIFFDDDETAIAANIEIVEATQKTPGDLEQTSEDIIRLGPHWMVDGDCYKKIDAPHLQSIIESIDPVGLRSLGSSRHINNEAQCPAHLQGTLKNPRMGVAPATPSTGSNPKGKNKRQTTVSGSKATPSDNQKYLRNLQVSLTRLSRAVLYLKKYTIRDILKNEFASFEGTVLSVKETCNTPLEFSDIEDALDNGDINEYSINRSLSAIKYRINHVKKEKDLKSLLVLLGSEDYADTKTAFVSTSEDCARTIYDEWEFTDRLTKGDTLIDTCAGHGTFLIVAIMLDREVNKTSKLSPKNVYYNDVDPKKVALFKEINTEFKLGIPKKNITCLDAKDENFMKNRKPFTWEVGNHPFNDDSIALDRDTDKRKENTSNLDAMLYQDNKELAENRAVIIRSAFLGKSSKLREDIFTDRSVAVILNTTKFFNVIPDTMCVISKKDYDSDVKTFVDKNGNRWEYKTDKDTKLSLSLTAETVDIFDKIKKGAEKNGSFGDAWRRSSITRSDKFVNDKHGVDFVEITGNLGEPLVVKKYSGNELPADTNKWRTVLNVNGRTDRTMGAIKAVAPDIIISNSMVSFASNSKLEEQNKRLFLEGEFVNALSKLLKVSPGNSSEFFAFIPMFDFSSPVTDKKIRKVCKLTAKDLNTLYEA